MSWGWNLKNFWSKTTIWSYVVHVYEIEFQKRGWQHAHILLILVKKEKPNDFERIVSSEIHINTLNSSKKLYVLCGKMFPNLSCMTNEKGSRNFPKNFYEIIKDNLNWELNFYLQRLKIFQIILIIYFCLREERWRNLVRTVKL